MTVNQLSIFLENKCGKLPQIISAMAKANIRIIAASVADTSEYGILRMIVDDADRAYNVLKESNVSVNKTDVLAIVTHAQAAGFAETLQAFTCQGINIEYMYCFSVNDRSIMIIRTNNREAALQVIQSQHMEYLTQADLMRME